MESEQETMAPTEAKETGCCPKFNPEPWDEKEFVWENKKFVTDHVSSFFHIPLNFGKVMSRNSKKFEKNNVNIVDDMVLSDEYSLWGSHLLFNVSGDVPDANYATLSGTFLSKVFEGSFQDVGKWTKEMESYVKSKNKEIKKMYFWYTTCPKCAKTYKKNYVVLFAQTS